LPGSGIHPTCFLEPIHPLKGTDRSQGFGVVGTTEGKIRREVADLLETSLRVLDDGVNHWRLGRWSGWALAGGKLKEIAVYPVARGEFCPAVLKPPGEGEAAAMDILAH
jgi:hypothetical protein